MTPHIAAKKLMDIERRTDARAARTEHDTVDALEYDIETVRMFIEVNTYLIGHSLSEEMRPGLKAKAEADLAKQTALLAKMQKRLKEKMQ